MKPEEVKEEFEKYLVTPNCTATLEGDKDKNIIADRKMFRRNTPYLRALRRDNPGFLEAEAFLRAETEFKAAMIDARKAAGLSQKELAAKIGTKQPDISRMEKCNALSCRSFAAYMLACGCTFSITVHKQGAKK